MSSLSRALLRSPGAEPSPLWTQSPHARRSFSGGFAVMLFPGVSQEPTAGIAQPRGMCCSLCSPFLFLHDKWRPQRDSQSDMSADLSVPNLYSAAHVLMGIVSLL